MTMGRSLIQRFGSPIGGATDFSCGPRSGYSIQQSVTRFPILGQRGDNREARPFKRLRAVLGRPSTSHNFRKARFDVI
jgi:hypothetical protein